VPNKQENDDVNSEQEEEAVFEDALAVWPLTLHHTVQWSSDESGQWWVDVVADTGETLWRYPYAVYLRMTAVSPNRTLY
jgi:hypothetical protein